MKKLKKALITVLSIIYFFNSYAQLNYKSGNYSKNLDSTINELLDHINPDSVESFMRGLESFGTRYAYADNHREVAIWIVDKFQDFGFEEVYIDSFPLGSKWQFNISVIIQGSINPYQVYIIGGHWDSWSDDPYNLAPGADDNASGTAATMEIARVMKLLNYQPESTIRFILFDTEELGLIGSRIDAGFAAETGINIKLMINIDMIANADSGDTRYKIHKYDNAIWAAYTSQIVAENYTLLNPVISSSGPKSDSYAYYEQNYPAVYFEEFIRSPNYHQTTELTDYLNVDYCTEITKASCALLIYMTTVPYHSEKFIANQTGDGISLQAIWEPVYNADIKGYKLYVSTNDNNYVIDEVYYTTDTAYLITNLNEGIEYYLELSAIDIDENEGYKTGILKIPQSVSLDQGIAIIDESYGGILNPTDEDIDDFYEYLLQNYEHTRIDILDKEMIGLSELGKYSSVIWHQNELLNNPIIHESIEMLSDYLELGGNLLITADKVTFSINGDGLYNAYNIYDENDFIKEHLGIDSSFIKAIALFSGALSNNDYPELEIDTIKTEEVNSHHLQLVVEAIFPGKDGEAIYLYNSDYNIETNQGMMKNMPVAVLNSNETFNALTLGFPLYYMNLYQSKIFIDQVLQNVFGESTNATKEITDPDNDILIWPNPTSDIINISFKKFETTIKQINIYDIYGNIIQQAASPENIENDRYISIQNLETGMYFLSIETSNNHYSIKIIKQ